jgi:acyl-[acyl carrier protein]--UDP-N-acetylglucosamine O-acyltransferase
MKKRNRALFAIIALSLIIAGYAFLVRDIPPTIPEFDEARFTQIGDQDLKRVEINNDDLEQLRQIIKATKRDRSPMKWAVLGILELRANGTTISTIQLFSNSNGAGPLEIANSYYLGYDQESFEKILGRAKSIDTP